MKKSRMILVLRVLGAALAVILTVASLSSCSDGKKKMKETETVPAAETETGTETEIETETETEAETETEPVTEPPQTEPPETDPPVTEPVRTEPPITEPVWTEPPAPPETEPPAPPVTEPPAPPAPEETGEVTGTSATGFPIEVRGGITYVGGLMVANKTYSLPASYDPGGLTPETYSAFVKMQSAAALEGLSLYSVSDYRSYAVQSWLYQVYADRDGYALADTYSARPGHSEHQTGLAIDINSTLLSFADTPEGQWLAAHCWEYGFIIRYPADKVAVTGYMYEPWHVRYVGTWLSIPMRDSGQCLEEYLGITSVYNY